MNGPVTTAPRGDLAVAHHHPGRLRVRSEVFAGRDPLAVRRAISALPGVRGVEHNAQTGSLLIDYAPGKVDPQAIIARALVAGDLALAGAARREDTAERVVAAARALDDLVSGITGARIDLRTLVPAALAGLSAYSFVRHRPDGRIPRWDNLLYWAYATFSALHRREIDGPAREVESTR